MSTQAADPMELLKEKLRLKEEALERKHPTLTNEQVEEIEARAAGRAEIWKAEHPEPPQDPMDPEPMVEILWNGNRAAVASVTRSEARHWVSVGLATCPQFDEEHRV